MSAIKIQNDLFWVGALDPELRIFDVIMKTQHGTTYNSYLLKTSEGNILFETAKERCFDEFIERVKSICALTDIKYLVVNHTEPDHAGSIAKLIEVCPQIQIFATSIAIDFLSEICNEPLNAKAVIDNEKIKIGQYTLEFLSVPFLHWPDSMYTYIPELETLVTCDSFGAHFSDEKMFNDLIQTDFIPSAKYYFDMIFGPFKSHIRYALERIKNLPIKYLCPGHGPIWRDNLEKIIKLYAQWSEETHAPLGDKPLVVMPYVSAYGYTEQIAKEIAKGIHTIIPSEIELYDMVNSDPKIVLQRLIDAQGILFGSPTVNGDVLPPIMGLLAQMNGVQHGGKVAGAFGSYGWSGEGPEMLHDRLKLLRMDVIDEPLKIRFKPSTDNLKTALLYGEHVGRKLKESFISLTKTSSKRTLWKCTVCGEIFESALPPKYCPACGAGAEAMIAYTQDEITFSTQIHANLLIIGGGTAAVSAALMMRQIAPEAKITILSAEKVLPYYRPTLTKTLASNADISIHFLHDQAFYDAQKITIKLGTCVSEIDKNFNTIKTEQGERFTYDKLLIATGANSIKLPIEGIDLQGIYTLRNIEDFNAIKQALQKPKQHVVVVGGGLLGLETAWQMIQMGHEVSIIETFPILLPRQLDSEAATLLKQAIKGHVKNIFLGASIEKFEGSSKIEKVILAHDKMIECDLVILSVGVRSEVSLANKIGLKIDRGIVVNDRMQSSEEDIFASGDCASFQGSAQCLWEVAGEQGKIAARAMCGDHTVHYKPNLAAALFHGFGVKIISIGVINLDDDENIVQIKSRDDIRHNYKKLVFKNDILIGGILIGDMSQTNLLITGVNQHLSIENAKDIELI